MDKIKDILGIKQKKRKPSLPVKEKVSKTVPTERFNDMIDYYTNELKSRIKEIQQLKQENEMLIKTSLRSASRADESRLQAKKLQEDVRTLQNKIKDK
jgi:hypothetical protein